MLLFLFYRKYEDDDDSDDEEAAKRIEVVCVTRSFCSFEKIQMYQPVTDVLLIITVFFPKESGLSELHSGAEGAERKVRKQCEGIWKYLESIYGN